MFNGPNKKTYISTATTTQVTPVGERNHVLEGLLIQAETVGTVKVYDDDDATSDIFIDLPVGSPVGPYPCAAICGTGIRVVTGGADKILVVYRSL